ncbi:SMP-30/gluconolactonase/LRE family protein [Mucilaginibacter sp. CSA2-8R]|uniref:SMP-30/gluconolactonase/LRE family protein n=1 Tax=Mucilaginibacter sp. CSA2-8R TaxID=3141542 RepID=UPI00315D8946
MKLFVSLYLLGCLPLTALAAPDCVTPNAVTAKVSISHYVADSTYSTTGLFAPGTQAKLVSKQFEFTEGPAADNQGNIFFTDQPNNTIWEYDTKGKLSKFADSAGRSNGMYFDRRGNLVTCADANNELWQFKRNGKRETVLMTSFNGKKFNGPNDLWIDAKGGIYFTDPYYQRPYWTRTATELDGQKVYYLPAGSQQARVASAQLQKPNGIAGTRDGKYLYVADIQGNKTYRFSIAANGELINPQIFTDKGSDGMTLDEQGNVYLTGSKGVYIFSPDGKQIGLIAIAEPWTANVCFGGRNGNTLFITASKAIYTFEMKVKGNKKNASGQL